MPGSIDDLHGNVASFHLWRLYVKMQPGNVH